MTVGRGRSTLARRHVSSGQTPLIKTIVLNLNGRLNIFKIKESQKSNRVYMLLSKACVYGLRAALFLAVNETDKYTPIRPMSEKLEISFHFLTKIMQQMTAKGILESYKGPNGGIRLTRPGDQIPLMEIVLAIDGPDLFTECALGLEGCGEKDPCPLHEKWSGTRNEIREMMENTTLSELVMKGQKENLRLTDDYGFGILFPEEEAAPEADEPDRKSTRLNSSHVAISYAVFCLKKKKKSTTSTQK